jgi:oligo-1,6-glucosidase
VLDYVKASEKELNMIFQFDMIRLGTGDGFGSKYVFKPWRLTEMKTLVERWQKFIEGTDGWTTVFCENHDNGRAVSRFGSDKPEHWENSAKMIALWQATLTGTLFLYQGQEIGMTNMPKTWPIEEYKDIESNNFYQEAERSVDSAEKDRVMSGLRILARDHSRLPFQWDSSAHGGFTSPSTEPWMRAHDDASKINVANQVNDRQSVLSFYKKVMALRKSHADIFIHGTFQLVDKVSENVFSYIKESFDGSRRAFVILNLSDSKQQIPNLNDSLGDSLDWHLLIGTSRATAEEGVLSAYEGRVYVDF